MKFLEEITRSRTLEELGRAVLRFAMVQVPRAQAASLLLLNDFTGQYEFVAAIGWDMEKLRGISFPKEKLIQHRVYGDNPAIIRGILEVDKTIWGEDVAQRIAEAGPVSATLTLPLWSHGELIGYLNLDHKEDPNAFSAEDLAQIQSFHAIFAGLLDFARKHEELKERESLFRLLFERLADAVYITTFDGTILEANPAAERQTGYSRAELIGKNIMWEIAAEEPAVTYEKVNELLSRGETVVFEEKKRRKDGSFYWTECAVTHFMYKGRLATLSVNRDITERKKLEEELSRRVAELATLNQAIATLTSQLERSKVVQNLVDLAKKLTHADYANVLLFDEKGEVLASIDPLGAPPLPLRMRRKGFTRHILETGQPLVLGEIKPDGTTVPEVKAADGTVILANPAILEAGIRSLAGFPVRIRGKVRGVFYVHSRKPHAFEPFIASLSSLANYAGIALENAELYEAVRQSEARYRMLFQESPISLWIEDFSLVKAKLDELRNSGVPDLSSYLDEHPEFLSETLGLLRVVEVNPATLRLYEAQSFEELQRRLSEVIPEKVFLLWRGELLAIWEGRQEFYGQGINRTVRGRKMHIFLSWRVLPGYEESYERVLVSILDLTAQREAEEALRRVNAALAAITANLELPVILSLIRDEARKLLNFDAFFVMQVDKSRGKLIPLFAEEEGERLELPELPLDPKGSSTAWVAVHGTPLFLGDVEKTPPPVPFQHVGRPTRAWACLPLVTQGEVIGVLSVQSFTPQEFGEREKMVLLSLANGAAAALRNALLYGRVRSTAEKLRRIEEVSRRMKLANTRAELYSLVLDAVTEIFGLRFAAIMEAREDALELVAHRGYPPELERLRLPFSAGQGITVAAFLADQVLYIPDVRGDPRYVAGLPAMGCELSIPLSMAGKKFGVLNVEHPEVDGIPAEDRDLLQILAAELTVALASLESLHALQTLSEKLIVLHEILQSLQRTNTPEEVCELSANALVDRLGFEGAIVCLARGEKLVPVGSAGFIDAASCPVPEVAERAWLKRETLFGNVEDFLPAGSPRFRSFLFVPVGEKGLIQVFSTKPSVFTKDEVTVVEILARHVYEELRRVELEAELREQAIRDPLTGLYNRRFLDEVLQREVARAARYGHPLSLILIDIDNFKEINDRYGHIVGDEALRRVARALRENIRRVDYIFRWGGDEFCVVLPETNGPGAQEVVRRFREPFGILAEEPVIRLTLGYASWDPRKEPVPSVEELFRRADALLYELKRAKPNP